MQIYKDKRIVLTLDAGGTNFVFSAMQAGSEIVEPVKLNAHSDNLDKCLTTLVDGFQTVLRKLPTTPSAISFAFPGPADYEQGIIDDLPNLPAFRGGIALGPMLEKKFNLPVFINNDGNLFVYGEAIGGLLPWLNQRLEEAGSPKRYKNLIGFTLGTGFGGGIVLNGRLLIGDNSRGGEAWLLRNMENLQTNIEESISIRAIKNRYAVEAGLSETEIPEPKDIFEISEGKSPGNRDAAVKAYKKMGEALGEAIATVMTLMDAAAVIGGGISAAHTAFLDHAVRKMNNTYTRPGADPFPRLSMKVFNFEDPGQVDVFLKGSSREIVIPGTDDKIIYDPMARSGVGISRLGTSEAVALGAYAFALNKLG